MNVVEETIHVEEEIDSDNPEMIHWTSKDDINIAICGALLEEGDEAAVSDSVPVDCVVCAELFAKEAE